MEFIEALERLTLADRYRKYRPQLPQSKRDRQWCVHCARFEKNSFVQFPVSFLKMSKFNELLKLTLHFRLLAVLTGSTLHICSAGREYASASVILRRKEPCDILSVFSLSVKL
jgi:hypothetical protein